MNRRLFLGWLSCVPWVGRLLGATETLQQRANLYIRDEFERHIGHVLDGLIIESTDRFSEKGEPPILHTYARMGRCAEAELETLCHVLARQAADTLGRMRQPTSRAVVFLNGCVWPSIDSVTRDDDGLLTIRVFYDFGFH